MRRSVHFLVLALASLSGCARVPWPQPPMAPAANGLERLPPIHPPPPETKKKGFWQRLWPWDDEQDAHPKTQKEIDDDFKWRNNG